jgi:hypothetical protein
VLKKRGYLGIDESNHGRWPEIFVAVYSKFYQDIVEHEKQLSKVRRNGSSAVLPVVKNRTFRHILIPENYGHSVGSDGASLVVISEFIKYFDDVEEVVIDGKPKWEGHMIENLETLVHPTKLPKVSFIIKGDTKFKLVNLADHVANLLHKYYSKLKYNKGMRYSGYLITPDFEGYYGKIKNMVNLGGERHIKHK